MDLMLLNKKKYLHSINWFRGLAIIFVVLIHIERRSLDYFFDSDIIGSIVGNGTFFFIFISGYLFWHLVEKFEYYRYIHTKIKNVLIPYSVILTVTMIFISAVNTFNQQPWTIIYRKAIKDS